MTEFTPLDGLLGGALIGVASVLLLIGNGRIAGISGIVGGLLTRNSNNSAWRIAFVVGLVVGGLAWPWLEGSALPVEVVVSWPLMLLAGLLVGFGARLGGGCTSGHGVCGIGRLSRRSMVASAVFMTTAALTTYLFRHVLGIGLGA